MLPLPVANILHHKLGSALSALGVAIGVCMLVTLSGLSRGSLEEVAHRWTGVDADLIVYPARLGDNISTASGGGLTGRDVRLVAGLTAGGKPLAQRVAPVYLDRLRIAGQEHNVVGARPADMPMLLGGRRIRSPGRLFDPDNGFARWLTRKLATPTDDDSPVDVSAEELARHGGLEMVIDSRLARIGKLKVGDKVHAGGHEFTVVGIVPEGALVRAFIPLATAQFLFYGGLGRSTLLFVKLRQDVPPGEAIRAIRSTGRLAAAPVGEFRAMLLSRFGLLYLYVDAVNAVTLIVAFLFVLVVLYITVIQRTREIALLRSMGATRGFVLRQVVCESLILTLCGAAGGVLLAFPAGAGIEALKPFLTVTITPRWILLAGGVALAGGLAAALYPAWRAANVDITEALRLD